MKEDEPLNMWSHWRNMYGSLKAIEKYYPNMLNNDHIVSHAHTTIIINTAALDSYMKEMEDRENADIRETS